MWHSLGRIEEYFGPKTQTSTLLFFKNTKQKILYKKIRKTNLVKKCITKNLEKKL
ncbi:hypothetical protein HanRHA438_Chr17g0836941 [Helianthus annuus]|nr:hypothetical protein HanRHA438_Chr17g0836941 [Helianthus annuus]